MTAHNTPTGRASLSLMTALSLPLSLFLLACSTPPASQTCSSDIEAGTLIGPWSAQIDGEPGTWALTLSPHPEHRGSLRGELRQGTLRYLVVADLDEGEFTMEESHDGRKIAATWLGRLSPPDCHARIQGQRVTGDPSARSFRLTRQP